MTATVDTTNPVKRVQRRSTKSERAGHISAWRETSCTQAAYCTQRGINATTFSGWLSAERGVGAKLSPARTTETARTPVQPPSVPRTLSAVAVQRSPAPLMSLMPTEHSVNRTASTAPIPPTHAHAIELTAGTRWRIGLSDAVSPLWLAGVLRALDECDPNASRVASNTLPHAPSNTPC